MSSIKYITIDVETTGLSLITDVPIQVAFQARSAKGDLRSEGMWYHKIDKPLPKIITEITAITDKTLNEEGVSLLEGTKKYNQLIWGNQPAVLLGYNIINFDQPIIQNWLYNYRQVGNKFPFPPVMQIIDVMQLCSIYFKTKKWLKQSEAARRLGLDFDPKKLHDASYDIDLCWRIFWKLESL